VQTLTELFGLGRSLYQRNQSGRSQV
jgi:hypothetical protein